MHGRGTGLRVASERTQHSHWPLLEVQARYKHRKLSEDDVPTRSTMVRHAGGGGGSQMHRFVGVIP